MLLTLWEQKTHVPIMSDMYSNYSSIKYKTENTELIFNAACRETGLMVHW